MSIKDTLTNNSMNSFSFGGKTYTRRVDNGAVVYDISTGTDGAAFSTGWVNEDPSGTPVANGATLTFNHNLGSTDFVASVMVANDASGTDSQSIDKVIGTSATAYGAILQNITNTSFTLQLGNGGFTRLSTSGVDASESFSGKYVKVILSAKMGSGGGTPAGSDRELQFNDNGAFGANANLRFDGSNLLAPGVVVGDGNVAGNEGGEMAFVKSPNSTLGGTYVHFDQFVNQFRFFEGAPPYKGAYLDLSECADGVGTNLLAGGSGGGGGGGSNWESVERVIDDTTTYTNTTGSTIVGISEIQWNQQDHVKLFVKITPAGGSEITIPVAQETNTGGGNLSVGSYFIPNGATYKFSANAGAGYSSPSVTDSNALFTVHNFYESTIGGGSGGGGASVTTDTTVPNNPSDGDLWYDENSAALYVYTDSIGGWIQANGGGGGGGTGPRAYASFNPTEGAASTSASVNISPEIYNSFNISSITDRGYFVYNGNQTGYRWTINLSTPVVNPVVHVSADNTATVGSYGLVPGSTTERYADIHANYHIEDDNTIHVFIVNASGTGLPQDSYTHMSVTIF